MDPQMASLKLRFWYVKTGALFEKGLMFGLNRMSSTSIKPISNVASYVSDE